MWKKLLARIDRLPPSHRASALRHLEELLGVAQCTDPPVPGQDPGPRNPAGKAHDLEVASSMMGARRVRPSLRAELAEQAIRVLLEHPQGLGATAVANLLLDRGYRTNMFPFQFKQSVRLALQKDPRVLRDGPTYRVAPGALRGTPPPAGSGG